MVVVCVGESAGDWEEGTAECEELLVPRPMESSGNAEGEGRGKRTVPDTGISAEV